MQVIKNIKYFAIFSIKLKQIKKELVNYIKDNNR